MEEQSKKMMNLMLYFVIIMALFSLINAITPAIRAFFKEQTGLMTFISAYPLHILIVVALLMAIMQTFTYRLAIDKDTLAEIKKAKEESKEMQKKMKELRNHPEKLAAMQKEMLDKTMQSTSKSLHAMFTPKSILISYLPSIIIVFMIIGPMFMAANVGFIFPITPTLPLYGKVGGWLFSIFMITIIFSMVVKKVMKSEI